MPVYERNFDQKKRVKNGRNYFSPFSDFFFLALRGWGGVANKRRSTSISSRLISAFRRLVNFFSVIGRPSKNHGKSFPGVSSDFVNMLIDEISDILSDTLGPSGYDCGLPIEMSTEIIVRAILVKLLRDGLINVEKINKVLQLLPLHSEYLGQYNLGMV